jgi:hypothetical protein
MCLDFFRNRGAGTGLWFQGFEEHPEVASHVALEANF